MQNMNLIPVTKVWNDKDGNYGQKGIFINPTTPFEFIEDCFIKKGNDKVACTKIFYPDKFIILLGDTTDFFRNCRESGIAFSILCDLEKEGLTIKQFLKQIEGFNNVELM